MLKHNMPLNPHKKVKYLSEIVQNSLTASPQHSKINYDSFIYIDRLTNNKILVGDVKKHYTHRHKQKKPTHLIPSEQPSQKLHKKSRQAKQLQQIQDCLSFIKSIKLFQMEQLKNKIFYHLQQSTSELNRPNLLSGVDKEKFIQSFIAQYINQYEKELFRKSMQSSLHNKNLKYINPNSLNFSQTSLNKFTKTQLKKIIQEFLQSTNLNDKKKIPINDDIQNITFPEQQRLKQLLIHRIITKNKDFQHLISPRNPKTISSKLYPTTQSTFRKSLQQPPKLPSHNFLQLPSQTLPTLPLKSLNHDKHYHQKIKQLLSSIQNGSIYDILFLIIAQPNLLLYRDSFGNNLLHLAAKKNQLQIYCFFVNKMGVGLLKQKNNAGKTPIQIASLFSSLDIQKINQEYLKNL